MVKKYSSIKSIILPCKSINYFVIIVLFLGIILGAIFSTIISINDKNLVIEKVKLFIDNINNNSLDHLLVFKNSIGINFLYIFLIWILGMSLIGIVINILLLFIKSFIFSFSIATFILTYGYKGIILSSIYLIFGQLLNLICVLILTIYSIMFAIKLFKTILRKNTNNELLIFLKNYLLILIFTIILSIVSSLSESFILPALIKIIIKLFL